MHGGLSSPQEPGVDHVQRIQAHSADPDADRDRHLQVAVFRSTMPLSA